MTTLQGQIEKMARDITTGPDFSDTIEIALVGSVVGGVLGYFKGKSDGAKSFAMWGAGLGVAGQYMLFHMLRPSARRGYVHRVGQGGAMHDICAEGTGWDSTLEKCTPRFCAPGTYYDDFYGRCMSKFGGKPAPGGLPDTLDDWRRQHKTGAEATPAPGGPCPPGLRRDPMTGACVPVMMPQMPAAAAALGYFTGRGGRGRGGRGMMPAHGHPGFHHGHPGHGHPGWGGGGWGGGGWGGGGWGADYPVPVPVPVPMPGGDAGEQECCDEDGSPLLDASGNPICPPDEQGNPACPGAEQASGDFYTGAVSRGG